MIVLFRRFFVVQSGGKGETEYKCNFKCPLCPRLSSASYKVYNVPTRKRNANGKAANRRRKPAWYFSSLQTHFSTHIGDEISDEVYLEDENEHSNDGAGNNDIENDFQDLNSNQKDITVAETVEPESPQQRSSDGLDLLDSNSNQENEATNANITQTPRRKLLAKFFKDLRENSKT